MADFSLRELFVGPALVVDDKIEDPENGIADIIQQIRSESIPLMLEVELPPLSQIKHFGSLSVIILDWDLLGEALVPGLSLPEGVESHVGEKVIEFVGSVLSDLYCPVFIFSSQNSDFITSRLTGQLPFTAEQLAARVLVKSKSEVSEDLFEVLTSWLASHPAMYALRNWERGYERAKVELFQDMQDTAVTWPQILWETSLEDKVNASAELVETISRNLTHRFQPINFDEKLLHTNLDDAPRASLQRVLHGQAVLRRDRLYEDVLMPGDFFYEPNRNGERPSKILINLTPACDLVARKGKTLDDVRMYLVEAEVLSKKAYANAEAVMTLLGPDAPTSQNVHFFMSTGEPYRVYFSRWTVSTWGELAASRQGRLMEPYITTLQQKNSLHLQRQGQPRIPQAFYLDGNVAALLEDGDDPDDNGEVSIPKTRDPTEDVSSRAWQRAKSRLLSIFTK